MTAVTERQILEALGQCGRPRKGADIVSLGMVSGVVVRDGNVAFAIEVEPERGPRLEPLRKAAEKAVEALPGRALGDGGADRAGGAARPRRATAADAGGRSAGQSAALVPGVRAIVAVASGKGGVGKSTVAANLALGLRANGLARRGARRRHLRSLDAAHARDLRPARARATARS